MMGCLQKHFHFAKSAINLENTLSFVKSKIVLFTPIEDSMQSATIAFNLGCKLVGGTVVNSRIQGKAEHCRRLITFLSPSISNKQNLNY